MQQKDVPAVLRSKGISAEVVEALSNLKNEPTWLTVGAVTGFLGAYTTFSAFAYETHDSWKAAIWLWRY